MKFRRLDEATPRVLNIGPLEDRILRSGMKGAKTTLDTLDGWVDDYPQIKPDLNKLHDIYQQLDPGFVNKVTSLDVYSRSLRKWSKNDSSLSTLKSEISDLESELNRDIASVKRIDSKRNRISQKNLVLRFWSSHLDELQALLHFREKVLDIITQL